MEAWRKVWREGFVPQLSTRELLTLYVALEENDATLQQGSTTTPPPLPCVLDWKCEGACLIGYMGWRALGLTTVGEVEEYFAKLCFQCDQLLGNPGGCRFLLNWFDDTPRDVMRRSMLAELDWAIAQPLSYRKAT